MNNNIFHFNRRSANIDAVTHTELNDAINNLRGEFNSLISDTTIFISNTYATKSSIILPKVIVNSQTAESIFMSDGATIIHSEPVGSVWTFYVPAFGTWSITATDSSGTQKSADILIDTVKIYETSIEIIVRYGIKYRKDGNGTPEYLFDAVGMASAYMDFTNGVFNYGDWANIFFVKNNKPLMMNQDGTIAYYLNPNDYSLKADGTPSDIADTDTALSAMAQFPTVWFYRYSDENYCYEIVSNVQYDENYKAYAHRDNDGNIKPYIYRSIYPASTRTVSSVTSLRSISGVTPFNNSNLDKANEYITNTGVNWKTERWMHSEMIRTLLILISRSTNSQNSFGKGYWNKSNSYLRTGTMDTTGQFFGYNDTNHNVKVFHTEDFWGNYWRCLLGLEFIVDGYGGYFNSYRYDGDTANKFNNTGYPFQAQAIITNCNEYGVSLAFNDGSKLGDVINTYIIGNSTGAGGSKDDDGDGVWAGIFRICGGTWQGQNSAGSPAILYI